MPRIQGFATRAELADHFDKHVTRGHEFAFSTEDEYEAAAIEFMSQPLDANIEEQVRARDNTTIRFNKVTKEIGFLHDDGCIGSYYLVRTRDAYAYYQRRCI